jgi:hypothetical protein
MPMPFYVKGAGVTEDKRAFSLDAGADRNV